MVKEGRCYSCNDQIRDVVCLGWPIAPSRIWAQRREEGGLRGLSQWVQLYIGAKVNFEDLTPYLTYGSDISWRRNRLFSSMAIHFTPPRPPPPPQQLRPGQKITCVQGQREKNRGRILGRIWDKSFESFPPCYSQSPLLTNFTPPPHPPWAKVVWNWFVMSTLYAEISSMRILKIMPRNFKNFTFMNSSSGTMDESPPPLPIQILRIFLWGDYEFNSILSTLVNGTLNDALLSS
jgi:hypothetical protein